MFKKVSGIVLSLAILFVIVLKPDSALALSLSSQDIVLKQDAFSTYSLSAKDQEVLKLKDLCDSKAGECLKKAKAMYQDKAYFSYKQFIVRLIVQGYAVGAYSLNDITFLSFYSFRPAEIKKIIENKVVNGGMLRLLNPKYLEEVFLNKPNLLCKFSKETDFVKAMSEVLGSSPDFYSLNFSKFPCGLSLGEELSPLLTEIYHSQKKNYDSYEYKFDFLRDSISRKVYKKTRKYRLRYKSKPKKLWAKILKTKGYAQEKILKNLFFRAKYEQINAFADLNSKQQAKLKPVAMVYVLKSFLARQKHKEILDISKNLNYQKSKWAEEILLARSIAMINLGKKKEALNELTLLLQNTVDLRLSGLYWSWVLAKELNEKSIEKAMALHILADYPFSYYGISVANHKNGASFFDGYKKTVTVSSGFNEVLFKEDSDLLKFYYKAGLTNDFIDEYDFLSDRFSPTEKALFSLVFVNLDRRLEAIKILNKVWDQNQSLRAKPFITASFPQVYKNELNTALKKKIYWMKPDLAWAAMRQESAFNPKAESSARARGLMQVLPSTAKEVARGLRLKKYKWSSQLFDPSINLKIGVKYMDRLISASEGYLPYAFASYNAGSGKMYKWSKDRQSLTDLRKAFKNQEFQPIQDLWVEELPWSETRFYVKALLRNYGIYKALYSKETFDCKPYWGCLTQD